MNLTLGTTLLLNATLGSVPDVFVLLTLVCVYPANLTHVLSCGCVLENHT